MSDSQCAESEPFALRVIGDDMAPEFLHGHVIIVDPAATLKSGCFVVAKIADEYLFRRLQLDSGKRVLQVLQADIADIELSDADSIVGVITQRSGKRRSEHKHYHYTD